jgi:hypothetical protein
VLGEEEDPVRTEDFEAWTAAEYDEACVTPEGEEDDDERDREIALAPRDQVGGRQETAVPTVVDAGRGLVPGASGASGDPRWLVVLGLLTLALAGARRRVAARR